MELIRCDWCGSDPMYQAYHDLEWGVPVWDDGRLFEFLTLETAQAGLSWITILRKREAYRQAFYNFDPVQISGRSPELIEVWMNNPGLIRNRRKLEAAYNNAGKFIQIQREFGSFAEYQWAFVGGKPVQSAYQTAADVPAKTEMSTALSKDLKRRGFKFLGPVVLYAHMQACGMVNDHLLTCFRHGQLGRD